MFDLALHYGEGPVSLSHISARQDISLSYLEQLFGSLRKEGLITSSRGAQGGYELKKPPDQITVGAVLNILEGTLAPVACVSKGHSQHCAKSGECVTRRVWESIHQSVTDVVEGITLQDMVKDHLNLQPIKSPSEGASS
jgi:Rrf2 family protein